MKFGPTDSYSNDPEESLAIVLEKILEKHAKDSHRGYAYLPSKLAKDNFRPIPQYNFKVLRKFHQNILDKGPIAAIAYLIESVIDFVYELDNAKSALMNARFRVEHWNRIECNVSQHEAVKEAWDEFRVHYKLSTGEDLPDFKDIKDVANYL